MGRIITSKGNKIAEEKGRSEKFRLCISADWFVSRTSSVHTTGCTPTFRRVRESFRLPFVRVCAPRCTEKPIQLNRAKSLVEYGQRDFWLTQQRNQLEAEFFINTHMGLLISRKRFCSIQVNGLLGVCAIVFALRYFLTWSGSSRVLSHMFLSPRDSRSTINLAVHVCENVCKCDAIAGIFSLFCFVFAISFLFNLNFNI